MITYDQELDDDCFRAATRTLLQDPMPGCPRPVIHYGWNPEFFDYLASLGWKYRIRAYNGFGPPNRRIGILSGLTSRGYAHAVVWDFHEDKLIHDPHPSREGIQTKINIYWFEPL